MVRSLKRIGYLETVDYLDGEPEKPHIFDLIKEKQGAKNAKAKTRPKTSNAKKKPARYY